MDEEAIETRSQAVGARIDRIARLNQSTISRLRRTSQFSPSRRWGRCSISFDQDYKDFSPGDAEADQGGLGLPDRDYYFKDDRVVELRGVRGARREDVRVARR